MEELSESAGIPLEAAEAIVNHREKYGAFQRLQELLDVPGMTPQLYVLLTGQDPAKAPPTIHGLLGFAASQQLKLKDVTDRIGCWEDVIGCVLGQSTGLTLVGETPKRIDKTALVAFAPKNV